MRIILSNHARIRAQMRNISFEEIVECILNPDKITLEEDSKVCYKKLTNENKKLLITYTSDSEGVIKVITVIKTSKVNKYL
ncbi:DUF4258 domain-containing protein [uncultured Arcticibacterium sp.]|uniref:DUF4258 domain-containing protein n=1 Tax=uncultured Arcticibacterium sp. TaxID=2173042 RepID=UPI0030FAD434